MPSNKGFKDPIIVAGILLAFLATPFSVSAAPSAGMAPDNPFYFLDIAFEKVNLFFTFSPERKAQKALAYAGERLAEAKEVAKSGKEKYVKGATDRYQGYLNLAREQATAVKDEKKSKELFEKVAVHIAQDQEAFQEIQDKAPEQTKEVIAKAAEASRQIRAEALEKIVAPERVVEKVEEANPTEPQSAEKNANVEESRGASKEKAAQTGSGFAPAAIERAIGAGQEEHRKEQEAETLRLLELQKQRQEQEVEAERLKLLEAQKQREAAERRNQGEAERAKQLELARQQETLKQQEQARATQELARQQRRNELLNMKTRTEADFRYWRSQRSQLDGAYQAQITNLQNQLSLDLADAERSYNRALENIRNDYASRGLTFSGMRLKAEADLLAEYNASKAQLNNYYQGRINALMSEKNQNLLQIDRTIEGLNSDLQLINQELD